MYIKGSKERVERLFRSGGVRRGQKTAERRHRNRSREDRQRRRKRGGRRRQEGGEVGRSRKKG